MAEQTRVLILGGYGVFSRQLAAEILQRTSAALIISGRSEDRALRCCQELGIDRVRPLRVDVDDVPTARKAFAGCKIVICAAGPFQQRDWRLALAAAEQGAHWLDISDSKQWITRVLGSQELRKEAAARRVSIMTGLSTVPAISGAMIRLLLPGFPAAVKARSTLYVANQNAKGAGAIHSALQSGFDDPVMVNLPAGRMSAYRFESPDEELIPREFGLQAEFRVAFEWTTANFLIRMAQRAGPRVKRHLAGILELVSRPFSRWGSDVSCLNVELLDGHDLVCAGRGLISRGQKLAVLPCAFAVEALLHRDPQPGVINPVTWLAPDVWVDKLVAAGIEFWNPAYHSQGTDSR